MYWSRPGVPRRRLSGAQAAEDRPAPEERPLAGWPLARSAHLSDPLDPGLLENRTTGRFDSPTGDYRVCYFATTLEACFGEILSRFRPDPGLSAIAQEEGFMALGEVPADWRHRRLAVCAVPATDDTNPTIRCLDVEAAETRALLRDELGELLAYHGYSDLDVFSAGNGASRDRTGDLLLANLAGRMVVGVGWASLALRRSFVRSMMLFGSGCFRSVLRPCFVPRTCRRARLCASRAS